MSRPKVAPRWWYCCLCGRIPLASITRSHGHHWHLKTKGAPHEDTRCLPWSDHVRLSRIVGAWLGRP